MIDEAAFYADLLADLNRLLREGLATVEWTEDDPAPRFHLTARGRTYTTAGATSGEGPRHSPLPFGTSRLEKALDAVLAAGMGRSGRMHQSPTSATRGLRDQITEVEPCALNLWRRRRRWSRR